MVSKQNEISHKIGIWFDLVSKVKILAHFQKMKYIKNQRYQNMSIIKVVFPFYILQWKKKIRKIQLMFEIKTFIASKPAFGFENRWQIHDKNFLRCLIWYAWFLWEALMSKVRKSSHNHEISFQNHRASASLWTNFDFLVISYISSLSRIILHKFQGNVSMYLLYRCS